MLNKFYLKFILFCFILFILALIIDRKNNHNQLPIFVNTSDINTNYKTDDYFIYISDLNDYIFPINIKVKTQNDFKLSYYDNQITDEFTEKIYMTFSLLTNYSNYLPLNTKTYIPKSTKIMNFDIIGNMLILNLSEDFLLYNEKYEDKILQIITYTFTQFEGIDKVQIKCENKEIPFKHFYLNKFSQTDFVINIFFKDLNLNNTSNYVVYYYTEIGNKYFLVPITVMINNNILSNEDNINDLLINIVGIPVRSFIDEEVLHRINLGEDIDKLAYYQYYLTFSENNLLTYETFNISIINNYEIELRY